MLKNWSKVVLVSMLVLVIGASLAFGTTSRVRSLANTGDYMSDDSNAFRWYSVLPSYANQVNAEMGTWNYNFILAKENAGFLPGASPLADSRAMSVNYAFGEDGKYGTYRLSLNEHTIGSPGLWSTNPFHMMHLPGNFDNLLNGFTGSTIGIDVSTPINKLDLGGGWEVGDAATVGVVFSYSGWKYKFTDGTSTTSWEATPSFLTLGVGGTWTNNEDLTVDGAFTFGKAGGKFEGTDAATPPNTTTLEFDASNAIGLSARALWDWKDDVTIVPVVDFSTSDYSLTSSPNALPPGNGDKLTNFKLGVGANVDVNGSNMLIVAAEFQSYKWEYSNADTVSTAIKEATALYAPTVKIALETEITNWLTTRVGASKTHIGTMKETYNDGTEEEWSPGAFFDGYFSGEFDWFLGVGFTVAEWTIDMELANETPFSLGWWLHGYTAFNDATYGPIGRISALYNF